MCSFTTRAGNRIRFRQRLVEWAFSQQRDNIDILDPSEAPLNPEWIPIRWPCGPLDQEQAKDSSTVREAVTAWSNPKTLSILDGGLFNAIIVTWAAGSASDRAQQQTLQPLIAEAKKRGLSVIGRTNGNPSEAARAASAAGLSAVVADNAAPDSDSSKIIPLVKASGVSSASSTHVVLRNAKWPRIPMQWRSRSGNREQSTGAGPTGAPWVDSNGWLCSLAAAMAPGKTLWTMAEPSEDVMGYRAPHYALAVADSAVYGATWVVAFDAETRKALASGQAKDTLKAVSDAIRFFADHKSWIQQPNAARLGIASSFSGPSEFIYEEVLNLMARRHVAYRVIDKIKMNAASLHGLKALLWLDAAVPDANTKASLTQFANAGGVVVAADTASSIVSGASSGSYEDRFRIYSSGAGRIAIATKPWRDPWMLAADTHLLLGRKYDLIRTYNAGTCNVRYTEADGRGVAQLVSYTARPMGHPMSIYVAHPYKTARWSNLNDVRDQPIELKPKGEGVEVYLPQFAPYAAIEFGG